AEVPISGQGLGLTWQKRMKSAASACGKMARLPCTLPGARPAVGPRCVPALTARRAESPLPGSGWSFRWGDALPISCPSPLREPNTSGHFIRAHLLISQATIHDHLTALPSICLYRLKLDP